MPGLTMRLSTVFTVLWIGLFACHVYAFSYSLRPNQVFWAYALSIAAFSAAVGIRSKTALWAAGTLVALHALYLLAFVIVSYWELIPGTTARHLPLISLDWAVALTGFVVGYRLKASQVVRALVILAWLVVAYTVGQWVLTPGVSRFGYGALSMLLLVVVVAYNRVIATLCLGLVMAGSNHVTPLAAGLAGVLFYVPAYYRGNVLRSIVENRRFLLLAFALPLATTVVLERVLGTFNRFRTLGDDTVRDYIVDNSIAMLRESGFMGIGYMNFYAWTGLDTGYREVARTGSDILGFNLHNSYMTWWLEGGVLVTIVVLVLLLLTIKRLSVIHEYDKRMGAVLYSWLVVFAIFAMFHQLHMTIQFWSAIGLIWGMHARLASYWRRRPNQDEAARAGAGHGLSLSSPSEAQ
jgi:hypothetical protein